MIGRPRKACLPCSSQKVQLAPIGILPVPIPKLRCVGQRPLCDRCKRLNRVCDWGDEDTGRERREKRPRRSSLPISSSSSAPNLPNLAHIPESHQHDAISFGSNLNPSFGVSDNTSYTGIPLTVVLRLVEVYFSYLYSAPLIFHKPTFLQQLRAGTTKSHVALSTCALASSFSTEPQSHNDLRDAGFSHIWAEQAGRLALLEGEEPDEDTVVSFTNLGLFWYSQGDWRRSLIYEGYAALNARLLRLSDSEDGAKFSLAAETRRRRFWASFLVNQFVSEPLFPKIMRSNISDVLLPVPEEDFEKGVIPAQASTLATPARKPSIFSELISILSLWTDVYETIKDTSHFKPTTISSIETLDARLRQWRAQLPLDFQMPPDKTTSCPELIRPQILLLHATYHQCMCALHCSIVPLFSLCKTEGLEWYVHTQRVSAQVAHDHACEITNLVRETLAQHPSDPYKWPGFVGFALYCSSAIQLPFMWSSTVDCRRKAQRNIRDNLSTMAMIGQNWRYVATLAVNLKRLYQHHSFHPIQLDGPPSGLSASQLAGTKRGLDSNSPISARNDNIYGHRRLVEQGKLTDDGLGAVDSPAPQSNDITPVVAQQTPAANPTAVDASIAESGGFSGAMPGQPVPSTSAWPMPEHLQSQTAPILSCLFPINDAIRLDLDDEDEYAMLLSATAQAGDLDNFNPENPLTTWFNG